MARKIMTRRKMRRELQSLVDQIGYLKEDRFLLNEQIEACANEAKAIFRKLPEDEILANDYRAVYESFSQDRTDWKSLALSFKPTKRKVKKFTKDESIERLRTFDISE